MYSIRQNETWSPYCKLNASATSKWSKNKIIQCKCFCPICSFTELMESRFVSFLTGSSCNYIMYFFPFEVEREFLVEKLNHQLSNCLDCSWVPTSLLSKKHVLRFLTRSGHIFINIFFTFRCKKTPNLKLLPNIVLDLWFSNDSGRRVPTPESVNKVLQSCIAVAYKPPALTHLHIITVLRAEINLSEGSRAIHKFAANTAVTNHHNLNLSP